MSAAAPVAGPAPASTGLPVRAFAEFLGSGLLAAIVIGSGAMAHQLTNDVALVLTINALATVFGLYVLIVVLGPVSGAHLNPAVTLVSWVLEKRPARDALSYLLAQILGCGAGAMLANIMFEHPAVTWGTNARATPAHLLAEVVATAGLILVIFLLVRAGRAEQVAAAVAAFIGAAYFFTSSTSFANPALTIGRMLTDTFAGIAPSAVPGFVGAQLVGAAIGVGLVAVLGRHVNRAPARSEPA